MFDIIIEEYLVGLGTILLYFLKWKEKIREISLYYHNTPYYCDFNHINKNSTNYISRYQP